MVDNRREFARVEERRKLDEVCEWSSGAVTRAKPDRAAKTRAGLLYCRPAISICRQHPLLPQPSTMANPLYNIYRLAVPVSIGVVAFNSSIYDVRGGSRAVIFDRLYGVQEAVVNEGTHFLIPWLQKAIVYDVRTKPRNISTNTGSKDLQMVSLTLRVLHRPEVPKLPQIYQVGLLCWIDGQAGIDRDRHTVSTTTNVSSPRSVTKCSRPSSPNSTPPSSSPSEKPSPTAYAPT